MLTKLKGMEEEVSKRFADKFKVSKVIQRQKKYTNKRNINTEIKSKDGLAHDIKDVPHGTIDYVHYYSKSLGGTNNAIVYLPPNYMMNFDKKYPVFYLISGTTDTEEVYYKVINQKTAALFEACSAIGAISSGASDEEVAKAAKFGQTLGIMFQIRDDIFDYYDSKEIGKPTGNDMTEGKLTLPVIYALNKANFESMNTLAKKVKAGTINQDEIAVLVEFTKQQGGIEYAEQRMQEFSQICMDYIQNSVKEKAIKDALTAYVDYVIERSL